jgi:hypothetical protein
MSVTEIQTTPLQDYSNMVIQGCSGAGKTLLVAKLLLHAHSLFKTAPSLIIFCYKTWQDIYTQIQQQLTNVHFLPNLPSEEVLKNMTHGHDHSILVADDMLADIVNSEFCSELFLRLSHHLKCTSILLVQNNISGKYGSNLTKNCHYTFLLKSARDNFTIRSLGAQLSDYKHLQQAYQDATKEPFSYLLVSTHPQSADVVRYRTDIFPTDPVCICYIAPNK